MPIDLFVDSLKDAVKYGVAKKLNPLVTKAEDLNNLYRSARY